MSNRPEPHRHEWSRSWEIRPPYSLDLTLHKHAHICMFPGCFAKREGPGHHCQNAYKEHKTV